MPHSRAGPRMVSEGSRQRMETSKRTWSLPLAGTAVGDDGGPPLVGQLHHLLGDERAGEGRHQGVLLLVEGVALRARSTKSRANSSLASMMTASTAPARRARCAQALQVLRPAHVDQRGDDVHPVRLFEVGDHAPRCRARRSTRVRTSRWASVSLLARSRYSATAMRGRGVLASRSARCRPRPP